MFEYIFWYEVNQWFLNDVAQNFWKILGFQKMINSHDVQLVNWVIGAAVPEIWKSGLHSTRAELPTIDIGQVSLSVKFNIHLHADEVLTEPVCAICL